MARNFTFPFSNLLRSSALGLVLCALPITAQADTAWTGVIDNDWFNAGNWDNGVPDSFEHVSIDTTTNMPNITSSGALNNSSYIGETTAGSLTVSSGGTLTSSDYTFIAKVITSVSTITITDPGSTWNGSSYYYIGYGGTGTINILNGGTLSNTVARIGVQVDSNGSATVSGAGSTWESSGKLFVANNGVGILTVSEGGSVSNTEGYIGYGVDAMGTVKVTGAGSTWESSGSLFVANHGVGMLTVSEGGSVSNTKGYIGFEVDAMGTVKVTGAGSTWTNSGNLFVGISGTGTLTVSDSGIVSTISAFIANGAGSTGTLNIGSASGDTAIAAGVLDTPTVAFGSGTGTLLFNHTEGCGADGSACGGTVGDDTAYEFTPDVTGSGAILAESGVTIMSGDLSAYTGTTTVTDSAQLTFSGTYGGDAVVDTDSTLVANSTVSGTVTVNSGGTLKGSGTVGGVAVASGGIVAPGNSIGTLNVAGNVSFASGSFLDVEVDADGNSDLTHATGTATITGGTVRLMPELSSDLYALDSPYTILTADGGVGGTFTAVDFFSPTLFLSSSLSYDATNVYATVTRNATAFSDYAASFNEQEVARVLDAATSGAAFMAVAQQGTALAAQDALDRLSGELHANVKGQLLDEASGFSRFLMDQIDDTAQNLWAVYYGDWRNAGDDNSHSLEIESNGVAIGRTKAINDNIKIGFALAFDHSGYSQGADVDNKAEATSDNYRMSAYTTYDHGPWDFKAGTSYGYHFVKTDRRVVFVPYDEAHRADYGAHSLTGFGEASYKVLQTEKLTVQPYASLSYSYGFIESFTETGSAGLTAQNDGYSEGRSRFGVRMKQQLSFNKTPAQLKVDLGWLHRIGPEKSTGTYSSDGASSFQSQSMPHARDTVSLSTGLDFKLTDQATLNLTYDTQQGQTSSSHAARAGVKVLF